MVPFSPSSGSLACREATRSPDGFSSSTCSTAQGAAQWHRIPFRLPPQTLAHGTASAPSYTSPAPYPRYRPLSKTHRLCLRLDNMEKSAAKLAKGVSASPPPVLPCLTTSLAALGHAATVSCRVMGGHYLTCVTSKTSTARKIQGSMKVLVLSAPTDPFSCKCKGVSTDRLRGQSTWQWKAISSVPTSQPREVCNLWKCSWQSFLSLDIWTLRAFRFSPLFLVSTADCLFVGT